MPEKFPNRSPEEQPEILSGPENVVDYKKLLEKKEKESQFDVEKPFNTKGFPEFLGKYPDAETLDVKKDAAKIEERFNVFLAKENVRSELKNFYKREVYEKGGIPTGEKEKSELRSVDYYVEKQAVKDPELVLTLNSAFELSKTFEKRIQEAENRMKIPDYRPEALRSIVRNIKKKQTEIAEKLEKEEIGSKKISGIAKHYLKSTIYGANKALLLFINKMSFGFFEKQVAEFEMKAATPAREWEARKKRVEALSRQINALAELAADKEDLAYIKGALIRVLPVGKKIKGKAQDKIADTINTLVNPEKTFEHSLEKMETTKEYIQALSSAKSAADFLGKVNLPAAERELDKMIENRILRDTLFELFDLKLASSPLNQVNAIFQKYLGKKELTPAVLRSVEKIMTSPRVAPAKKILLKAFLMKQKIS